MKNNLKYLVSAMLVASSAVAFTSCDDWTEPESIDTRYLTLEDNPEYAEYCAAIRKYRATDHRQVYAWIANPEAGAAGQGQRLTAMPDSVDVIVLEAPGQVSETTLADMATVRERFAQKVMYTIDFDALNSAYALLAEDLAAQRGLLDPEAEDYAEKMAALATPDRTDYVLDNLTKQLSYVKTTGFDGVIFAFDGKATNHLTESELAEYNALKLLCLGSASDWHNRFPAMKYDYIGIPQYLAGTPYVDEFGTLFIREGASATNGDIFQYLYNMACDEGVPAEKIGMLVSNTTPADSDAGVLSDKSLAIDALTKWVGSSPVHSVGVLIAN
ncbi:MAG: hypothetical protein K2M94_03400, partial [Paramuribaculum sp.]|nr:hypothetical protein [Paramuribaculum sp.]